MNEFGPLRDLLRDAARRSRRRRFAASLLLGLFAAPATGCLLEFVRLTVVVDGRPLWPIWFVFAGTAAVLVASSVIGFSAAAGRIDETKLARELDRRLGLGDRTAAALAVERGEVRSSLASALLAEAAPRFRAALPEMRPAFAASTVLDAAKKLSRGAFVLWLLLLALLIVDLLRLLELPFGLLAPGPRDVGVIPAADPEGRADAPLVPKGAPREGGARPKDQRGEPSQSGDGDRSTAPRPNITVELGVPVLPLRSTDPVVVTVEANASGPLGEALRLRAEIEVDGQSAPLPDPLAMEPGPASSAGVSKDLRRVGGLARRLGPGEHQVRARLRDATGVVAESESQTIRVQPDHPPDAESAGQPPPPPTPSNGAGAGPPPPEETSGGVPQAEIDARFREEAVLPLFGEGEEIVKRGLRPVVVPGESAASAPKPRADMLPSPTPSQIEDAAARAENAIDRGVVRPPDRALVRRYFELLRKSAK